MHPGPFRSGPEMMTRVVVHVVYTIGVRRCGMALARGEEGRRAGTDFVNFLSK